MPEEAKILYREKPRQDVYAGKGHTLAYAELLLEPLKLRRRCMMLEHQALVQSSTLHRGDLWRENKSAK